MTRTLLLSLLFLAFFISGTHNSSAQSAVYYCPDMGSIGYSYSDDETGHDLKNIKDLAKKSCEQMGGKNCTLLYATPKVGWGGFVSGKNLAGDPIVIAVGHQLNERFVRSELKRRYLAADGIEFNDVLLITWHAD